MFAQLYPYFVQIKTLIIVITTAVSLMLYSHRPAILSEIFICCRI